MRALRAARFELFGGARGRRQLAISSVRTPRMDAASFATASQKSWLSTERSASFERAHGSSIHSGSSEKTSNSRRAGGSAVEAPQSKVFASGSHAMMPSVTTSSSFPRASFWHQSSTSLPTHLDAAASRDPIRRKFCGVLDRGADRGLEGVDGKRLLVTEDAERLRLVPGLGEALQFSTESSRGRVVVVAVGDEGVVLVSRRSRGDEPEPLEQRAKPLALRDALSGRNAHRLCVAHLKPAACESPLVRPVTDCHSIRADGQGAKERRTTEIVNAHGCSFSRWS